MLVFKECGITMEQLLKEVNKREYPKRYTYTTRLDPMALGIVNFIDEEEFKNIKEYLVSNKIYTVRVILGYQTDSDDVLGLIENRDENFLNNHKNINDYLEEFEIKDKTFSQEYHYFSSKRIMERWKGKEKKSYHNVTIHKCKVLEKGSLDFMNWLKVIMCEINKVDKSKNFRQEEILSQWSKEEFKIINYLDLELDVSHGFFVRQFIRDMSNKLKIPMMAYHITRKNIY